jgi:hypothetical protein
MGIDAQGIHTSCCIAGNLALLTIDLPLQDVAELLWQFRTNAGVISGRLKREPFF